MYLPASLTASSVQDPPVYFPHMFDNCRLLARNPAISESCCEHCHRPLTRRFIFPLCLSTIWIWALLHSGIIRPVHLTFRWGLVKLRTWFCYMRREHTLLDGSLIGCICLPVYKGSTSLCPLYLSSIFRPRVVLVKRCQYSDLRYQDRILSGQTTRYVSRHLQLHTSSERDRYPKLSLVKTP